MVDENEFIREITLRLCRNLQIEQGLADCLDYLNRFIPADALYLQQFDPSLSAMHVIARAGRDGSAQRMDTLVPLPPPALAAMERAREAFDAGTLPTVIVVNRSADEPITRAMLELVGEPASCAMSLPLIVQGTGVGTLVVLAAGEDRYTEEHARLYASVKEPFYVALSNAVRHNTALPTGKRYLRLGWAAGLTSGSGLATVSVRGRVRLFTD